jgi:hypothetical protein
MKNEWNENKKSVRMDGWVRWENFIEINLMGYYVVLTSQEHQHNFFVDSFINGDYDILIVSLN